MSRSALLVVSLCAAAGCADSRRAIGSPCESPRDCPGLVCDPSRLVCVQCLSEADCESGHLCMAQTCRTITTCTSDGECAGARCDSTRGFCVDCIEDADCSPSQQCSEAVCVQRVDAGTPPPTDQLDLLFMIDNSGSMMEEQASLTSQFESLVTILSTGDFNFDGDTNDPVDFSPFSDLNVGVVTSDMGTGGFTVPTCARADFGDDGLLRTQGNTAIAGCMATYPRLLNYQPASATPAAAFARDFQCVATVGTGGCGFEQQLEAALKAVMPSSAQAWTAPGFVPVSFFRGTPGHGDVENAGLARADSVLAIAIVTDEEDCSLLDPELINPTSTVYSGDLNLRCHTYGARAAQPVERYVDGFLSLRRDPRRLVFAVIAGIPPDLAMPDSDDFAAILADPRMQEVVDPTMPNRLDPSCNVPGRGLAFPPRRIVSVAEGLHLHGVATTVQSICQDNFSGALSSFVDRIARGNR